MKSKRKPEINCQKQKNTNTQRLNSQYITEEVREEIRKHLRTNENKNTAFQNLWDTAKIVIRKKFTVIQAYLNKQQKSQMNNLTYYLKI